MVHSWEQIWIRVLFLLVSSFPSLFPQITQNLPRKFLSSRESESVNRLAYKMWDNRSSRVSVDEQWALGVEPLKILILLFFITQNTARMAKIFLAISCMLFANGECYFTTFLLLGNSAVNFIVTTLFLRFLQNYTPCHHHPNE